ncbi:uncharacterized protein LOC121054306 [Oryza brachyantha]|uniref:uncharacterized protein LOC121054306 n=1 Tax=Oryza brachyantha TaxID=4533 RepID=UPI001ADA27E6|nr:uncharacterized protein LOC121054306 [Oryza brachyantha]
MSDYVSELERFLMEEEEDGEEVFGPDGERKMEDLTVAAYSHFSDDNTVAATTDGGGDPGVTSTPPAAAADDLDAPEDEATSRKRKSMVLAFTVLIVIHGANPSKKRIWKLKLKCKK